MSGHVRYPDGITAMMLRVVLPYERSTVHRLNATGGADFAKALLVGAQNHARENSPEPHGHRLTDPEWLMRANRIGRPGRAEAVCLPCRWEKKTLRRHCRNASWALAGAGLLLPLIASAANHVVEARSNLTFSPSTLTIVAGDTVTFRNAGGFHNAVSDPGAVTSFRCANGCDATGGNGNLSSTAWSATVAFPSAGTVGYFCEAHGAAGGVGMSGKITVNPAPVTVQARHDFNGDGKSDVLWRNTSSGANVIWLSAVSASPQALPAVATAWRVVGSGDYNGDGRADILWRNSSTGGNAIWRSGNPGTPQAVTAVTNLAWTVVGSGDYNGDGKSDVLWRNTSSGANVIWLSAVSASPQALPAVATAWRVVGSGDYNGDGRADILWRNSSTGGNAIWRSGNPGMPQAVTAVTNLAWTVVGSGD